MKNYSDNTRKIFFAGISIVLILITTTIWSKCNAQWFYGYPYHNEVTSMNTLTKDQLLMIQDQSTKSIQTGKTIVGVSTPLVIAGGIIYFVGLSNLVSADSYSEIDRSGNTAIIGYTLISIGSIGLCIGVPIWWIGSSRLNNVNIHLKKFDESSYIPSLSFSFTLNK